VATLGGCLALPISTRVLEGRDSSRGASAAGARARGDLNGQWERRIDGELYDLVQVPSSLRPSGNYRLRR
jgi:hypothetical protein